MARQLEIFAPRGPGAIRLPPDCDVRRRCACACLCLRCASQRVCPRALPRATDEVSAVVVDIGSTCTKAGYAGEDCPKFVFPSVRSPARASQQRARTIRRA